MNRKCWKCDENLPRNELQEHHVIPKCLFDEKRKADKVRVLACEECHQEMTNLFLKNDEIYVPNSDNLVVKNG